jgi:hypothetical protein
MRNVNLAHGSLYLLGAYLGYEVTEATGVWLLGVAAGFAALAVIGLLMQVFVFRRLKGDELRQPLRVIRDYPRFGRLSGTADIDLHQRRMARHPLTRSRYSPPTIGAL